MEVAHGGGELELGVVGPVEAHIVGLGVVCHSEG